MKNLTGSEIAKLAGVSRSTVSRVVNGYSNVPEVTKKRVMKIINEHEYYPLLSGQLLAGKRTGTLGFFWISETPIAHDILSNAIFAHVSEAVASLGYLVLVSIIKNLTDEENIQAVKKLFMQERIDAGIFVGANNNEPLIEELIEKEMIVGLFSHFHPDRHEPNRISVNFEKDTGSKVIDYVYKLGHRKIAVIDGIYENDYCLFTRHESFMQGMMQHGIEIRPEWMYQVINHEDDSYIVTKNLIAECRLKGEFPTVICTFNDAAAFGVYSALHEENILIPDQISVIGIDGHEAGKLLQPQLTTFAFDFQKFFLSLADRTIKTVEQSENVPLTEFFTSTLIERESCRRI